jgi:hypothetical protein
LQRHPAKRLGSGRGDAFHVKQHTFFRDIDWHQIDCKVYPVPWKPSATSCAALEQLQDDEGATNHDPEPLPPLPLDDVADNFSQTLPLSLSPLSSAFSHEDSVNDDISDGQNASSSSSFIAKSSTSAHHVHRSGGGGCGGEACSVESHVAHHGHPHHRRLFSGFSYANVIIE